MELVNVCGGTWVVPGPVNVGVYVSHEGAVLIDSGNDDSAARKILKLVESSGWTVKWIINTHSHADHIGGNAFIQKRTGCGIAASSDEAPFINCTELEVRYLWSGAAPRGLRNKFLLAESSRVTRILNAGDRLEPYGLKAVGLPGHMYGQIGVMTPDGVMFAADAALSGKILEKYGIPFISDFGLSMSSLDTLEKMEAWFFVPSHGDICSDIRPLAEVNRACLHSLAAEITEICRVPSGRDDILRELASRRGTAMNLGQYVLVFGTVSAVTSHLTDSGVLSCSYGDGVLKFTAC